MTTYHYNGLTASVIAGSEGEAERRMLSWRQQNQLGRTTLLRSYTPGGDEWSLEAEISLNYDTADRLTQVYRRDGGERRWQRISSVHYDFAGRKTGMNDADLGHWSYAYNTLGQLTRQTDARDQTSCLYYDDLGRMRGRVQRTDGNCAATVADADLASSYSYDPQGRVQRVANANVSRSFRYDGYSRLNRETVTIDSLTRSSAYSYDDYHRPTAVTYHGGEVVTTEYGSPGAAVGLRSSIHGDLVDNVSFDEAGRMTALRLPAGGNLWRTQRYYPWSARRNGGMLAGLKVGYDEGTDERLSRGYAYNSFGEITALTEGADSYAFSYDGLGRLTSAYGRSYSYDFGHCRLHLLDTWQWQNSQPSDCFQRPDLRLRRLRAVPCGRQNRQRRPLRLRRQRQHDEAQQGAGRPADAGVGRREPALAGAGQQRQPARALLVRRGGHARQEDQRQDHHLHLLRPI